MSCSHEHQSKNRASIEAEQWSKLKQCLLAILLFVVILFYTWEKKQDRLKILMGGIPSTVGGLLMPDLQEEGLQAVLAGATLPVWSMLKVRTQQGAFSHYSNIAQLLHLNLLLERKFWVYQNKKKHIL